VGVATEIPQPVDAQDGFDGRECRTEEAETDLANTVHKMNLMLNQQGKENLQSTMAQNSL
jgi:hypothetical protein